MSRNRWLRVGVAMLVPVAVLSCHEAGRRLSTRNKTYGTAILISVYHSVPVSDRLLAVLHVLMVPAVDPPKTMGTANGVGFSGSAERGVIDYTYYENSPRRSIHAEPLKLHEDRTLTVGPRSFDLKNGNLFVADVSPSGAVTLTQLPVVRRDEENSDAVLRQIQAAVPQNARVQALTPR